MQSVNLEIIQTQAVKISENLNMMNNSSTTSKSISSPLRKSLGNRQHTNPVDRYKKY